MEVQGKIKLIGETQTVGSNGFRKRELVVTTEEQYPQHLSIDFVQDKTDLLNNFQVGQPVKVGINLRVVNGSARKEKPNILILFKAGVLTVCNRTWQRLYLQYPLWRPLNLPKT